MADLSGIVNRRDFKPAVGQGCASRAWYTTGCDNDEIRDQCIFDLLQQVQSLQQQIDLLGGGGGAQPDLRECGPINVTSLDLSGQTACASSVDFSLGMSGINGDDSAGATASFTGDVVIFCDGVEVARRLFSMVDDGTSGNGLANNQPYSGSSDFSVAAGSCTGEITTGLDNVSTNLPGNGNVSATVCINSNCAGQ